MLSLYYYHESSIIALGQLLNFNEHFFQSRSKKIDFRFVYYTKTIRFLLVLKQFLSLFYLVFYVFSWQFWFNLIFFVACTLIMYVCGYLCSNFFIFILFFN